MEKKELLKELERSKNRINKASAIGIAEMTVVIEAISYIVRILDREVLVKDTVAAVKEPEKPKAEPEKKKRTVDYGKIVALHKAGWSQKKIADEMGVSQNAICTSLKRYKEKMEDGFIWDSEEMKFVKKV